MVTSNTIRGLPRCYDRKLCNLNGSTPNPHSVCHRRSRRLRPKPVIWHGSGSASPSPVAGGSLFTHTIRRSPQLLRGRQLYPDCLLHRTAFNLPSTPSAETCRGFDTFSVFFSLPLPECQSRIPFRADLVAPILIRARLPNLAQGLPVFVISVGIFVP